MNYELTENQNRYLIVDLWDIFSAETEEKCDEREECEHSQSLSTNVEDVAVTYKGEKLLADEYAVFSVLLDPEFQGISQKDLLQELKWPDAPNSYNRLTKSLRKLAQGAIFFENKGKNKAFSSTNVLSDLSWGSENEGIFFSIDERISTLCNNGRINFLEAFFHAPSVEY